MEWRYTTDTHEILKVTVPAGKRLAMSAIRAQAFVTPGGLTVSWVPSAAGHLDFEAHNTHGGHYQWATDVIQRCFARLQPLGSVEMDWAISQPLKVSDGNYGFFLRDTEQAPTAYPQDFKGENNFGTVVPMPDWCDGGFELFVTCGAGDGLHQSRFRNQTQNDQGPGWESWEFQVSAPEWLRNNMQPYDYLVYVVLGDVATVGRMATRTGEFAPPQ